MGSERVLVETHTPHRSVLASLLIPARKTSRTFQQKNDDHTLQHGLSRVNTNLPKKLVYSIALASVILPKPSRAVRRQKWSF